MAEENPTAPVLVPDGGSPERPSRPRMMGPRTRGRSHSLMPCQGGVPLMMQLASLLALSAMRSWERC
ncbi:hypothetical protein AAG906_020286 [Vitis piasezkii]